MTTLRLLVGAISAVAISNALYIHEPYGISDSACIPNANCNATNGCSWITKVYDFWYPMGACGSQGSAVGSYCEMSYRLCDHHIDYTDIHCSIFYSEKYVYQYGC